MDFFRNMDLYKAIILLSLVLLPLGWWWVTGIEEQIQLSEAALRNATRRGGFLEEIGQLERKIEIVAQNRRLTSDAIERPSDYFDAQIKAVNPNLRGDDFVLGKPQEKRVTIGRQKVLDHVVSIDWRPPGRDPQAYKMNFVYAVAFNCESAATSQGVVSASPSVWRLRTLRLENATSPRDVSGNKTPDPEMQDAWLIKEMTFARREPRAN